MSGIYQCVSGCKNSGGVFYLPLVFVDGKGYCLKCQAESLGLIYDPFAEDEDFKEFLLSDRFTTAEKMAVLDARYEEIQQTFAQAGLNGDIDAHQD